MTTSNWRLRKIADTSQARYVLIQRVLKGLGYRTNALDSLSLKQMRRAAAWSTERIIEELVMARRIQRKRTKGWRMPERTIYVGRPAKWGNIARIGQPIVWDGIEWPTTTAEDCVRFYRHWILWQFSREEIRYQLGGMNLACWCALDQPCHADVLLVLANA